MESQAFGHTCQVEQTVLDRYVPPNVKLELSPLTPSDDIRIVERTFGLSPRVYSPPYSPAAIVPRRGSDLPPSHTTFDHDDLDDEEPLEHARDDSNVPLSPLGAPNGFLPAGLNNENDDSMPELETEDEYGSMPELGSVGSPSDEEFERGRPRSRQDSTHRVQRTSTASRDASRKRRSWTNLETLHVSDLALDDTDEEWDRLSDIRDAERGHLEGYARDGRDVSKDEDEAEQQLREAQVRNNAFWALSNNLQDMQRDLALTLERSSTAGLSARPVLDIVIPSPTT